MRMSSGGGAPSGSIELESGGGHRGTATAGSATTATLQASAPASASATDDYYKGQEIHFVTGAARGRKTTITGYAGSTKVATIAVFCGAGHTNKAAIAKSDKGCKDVAAKPCKPDGSVTTDGLDCVAGDGTNPGAAKYVVGLWSEVKGCSKTAKQIE